TKLDPNNPETKQLRILAKSHVDEKIKEDRAKELAPETGTVHLPVPPPGTTVAPAPPPPPVTPPAETTPAPTPAPLPVTPPTPSPKSSPKSAATPPPVSAAAPAPKVTPAAALPAPPPPKPVMSATEYQQQGRNSIQQERFADAIAPLTQAVKLDPYLST